MLVKALVAIAAVSGVAASDTQMSRRTFGSWLWHGKFDGCSGHGSWACDFGGKPICAGGHHVVDHIPKKVHCPHLWQWQPTENCCVPPKPDFNCDCGEGFDWDKKSFKCSPSEPQGIDRRTFGHGGGNKCGSGFFWHKFSKSCCKDYSDTPPPENDCPPGKWCPKGWHWDAGSHCCKPNRPTTPAPDCKWNWDQQCCTNPTPSDKPGKPGHGGHWGGWGGWGKRDVDETVAAAKRNQNLLAGNDINPMDFCRGEDMIVCDIPSNDGKWLYECINFKTELDSCGGCVNTGTGQDCTAIPHAKAVSCDAGECKVWSCAPGYEPHGNTCRAVRNFF